MRIRAAGRSRGMEMMCAPSISEKAVVAGMRADPQYSDLRAF